MKLTTTAWLYQPFLSGARTAAALLILGGVSSNLKPDTGAVEPFPAMSRQVMLPEADALSGRIKNCHMAAARRPHHSASRRCRPARCTNPPGRDRAKTHARDRRCGPVDLDLRRPDRRGAAGRLHGAATSRVEAFARDRVVLAAGDALDRFAVGVDRPRHDDVAPEPPVVAAGPREVHADRRRAERARPTGRQPAP